jgi:hypothetical protein
LGIVDWAGEASLIVAKMDLTLVQLLRGAMQTVDQGGSTTNRRQDCFESQADCHRFRDHCPPIIAPRQVIHPKPLILPRQIIHQQPLVEQCPSSIAPGPLCTRPKKSPFPAPWDVLPWKIPIPPPAKIKQVIHRTDVKNKGSLLDMFI